MNSDEEEIPPFKERTLGDVVKRCLVLYGVLGAGHGVPRSDVIEWLTRESLLDSISPQEHLLLLGSTPTQQQLTNATWRAEALVPIIWALNLFEAIPEPTRLCDLELIQKNIPEIGSSTASFVSEARLRSADQIADANHEIYHIHWSVRDARLFGRPIPNSLVPGVVQERHYALNWLIGYLDQDWDDVTTDT